MMIDQEDNFQIGMEGDSIFMLCECCDKKSDFDELVGNKCESKECKILSCNECAKFNNRTCDHCFMKEILPTIRAILMLNDGKIELTERIRFLIYELFNRYSRIVETRMFKNQRFAKMIGLAGG